MDYLVPRFPDPGMGGAVRVAEFLGVSDLVIGLTIVALGAGAVRFGYCRPQGRARAGDGIVILPEWISFGESIDSLNKLALFAVEYR